MPSDMMLCVISYWVLSGAKRRQIQQLRCCAFPAKLLKRRDVYLKLTRHNGRAGAHGTYNPKHNDRSFNLANSEHIDPERAKGNIYWDCFHGFRSALAPPDPNDLAATFSDVERQFYETHYTAFVEGQNERNAKIRHTERNRSIPDLLSSRKTCPEETIYQLGTLDEHASAEDLLNIVTEFIDEFKSKFGDHVHVLDWALHLDESTPHIHERHVFDCENKYGEIAPQQEKALEALGFELSDPDKPLSRRNNRKITFDAACRKMLFEIAKRHGLDLEEEAEYGNRKYRLIQNNYQFTISERTAANLKEAIEQGNNILGFLKSEGYFEIRQGAKCKSTDFYKVYERWCLDNLEKPLAASTFIHHLKDNQKSLGIVYDDKCIGTNRGFHNVDVDLFLPIDVPSPWD